MLELTTLSDVLVATVTGDSDRALEVLATTTELDDAEREPLTSALADADTPDLAVRRLGDALRRQNAGQDLVNECYRAAFFASSQWRDLAHDPLFAYSMVNHSGSVLDKWPHYFPVYDRYFSRFRGTSAKVLEIGVYRGGGLDMWRWYFGDDVTLVGVDIDEVVLKTVGQRHTVVLGDQADPEFLRRLAAEHGPFDVVIDDGGHTMDQQIASAEALFPLVAEGGVYLVEDCHTSYWPEFGGGLGREGTFMEWVKSRLDDVNGYHVQSRDHVSPVWTDLVGGIHVHDSIVVLDRDTRFAPFAQQTGSADYLYKSRRASAVQSELLATRQAAVIQRDEARNALETAQTGALEDARLARSELAVLRPRLGEVEAELQKTQAELMNSWEQVKAMRRTVSWRVTAPLRRLRGGR